MLLLAPRNHALFMVLSALMLISWTVCDAEGHARSDAQHRSRAAFVATFAGRLPPAGLPLEAGGPLRARFRPHAPLRRAPRLPVRVGATCLQAQADDSNLRNEFEQLLGSSGRDKGMKGMKAPKGSLEWLKQQRNVHPCQTTLVPAALAFPLSISGLLNHTASQPH